MSVSCNNATLQPHPPTIEAARGNSHAAGSIILHRRAAAVAAAAVVGSARLNRQNESRELGGFRERESTGG